MQMRVSKHRLNFQVGSKLLSEQKRIISVQIIQWTYFTGRWFGQNNVRLAVNSGEKKLLLALNVLIAVKFCKIR